MSNLNKFLLFSVVICAASIAFFSTAPAMASAAYCSPNASKQCISNISYWYDSCGVLQSVAQNCNQTGQICQGGQCVNKITNNNTNNQNISSHYVKSCYGDNLYWFSAQGTLSDMAASCADQNSCTLDTCAGNKCVNELKCDGSTCATNSTDFTKYCGGVAQNQTNTTTNNSPQTTNQVTTQNLSISLFAKKSNESLQWEKSISANNSDAINFLVVVKNNSVSPVADALVTLNTNNIVTSNGNLKIDNAATTGNITSGIDLGSLDPKMSKSISFTATVQGQASQTTSQIAASVSTSGVPQDSDYITLTAAPQGTVTVTATPTAATSNSILDNFKKNWILWLVIFTVLIVVFVIIYRKLSSNV